MSKHRYAIGLDFGTESGRAVLVDVTDGREVATAVHPYGDGVIDEVLPGTDIELPHDFALQNPADYIQVLRVTIPAVLREGGVSPEVPPLNDGLPVTVSLSPSRKNALSCSPSSRSAFRLLTR